MVLKVFRCTLNSIEQNNRLSPGYTAPQGRDNLEILRQQSIKGLYLYLQNIDEEHNYAPVYPGVKCEIVTPPYSSKLPSDGFSHYLFYGALILGLLVPFLIIYLSDIFKILKFTVNSILLILDIIPW
jgi:hypothetical protein